jgi:hypothetical protein
MQKYTNPHIYSRFRFSFCCWRCRLLVPVSCLFLLPVTSPLSLSLTHTHTHIHINLSQMKWNEYLGAFLFPSLAAIRGGDWHFVQSTKTYELGANWFGFGSIILFMFAKPGPETEVFFAKMHLWLYSIDRYTPNIVIKKTNYMTT